MAEASRRLGVTTAAPYRHFADRDDLLAAVAARGLDVFAAMLAEAENAADPPRSGWRRWPAHTSGSPRSSARCSTRSSARAWTRAATPNCSAPGNRSTRSSPPSPRGLRGRRGRGRRAVDAIEASAHGYAMLLNDGEYGDGPDAVDATADRAIASARALIAGRQALRTRSSDSRTALPSKALP